MHYASYQMVHLYTLIEIVLFQTDLVKPALFQTCRSFKLAPRVIKKHSPEFQFFFITLLIISSVNNLTKVCLKQAQPSHISNPEPLWPSEIMP